MKIETTEEIAQCLLALGWGNALQVQQGAGLVVQRVELMLGKIADGEVFTSHQAPGQRLKLTGKVLDQGGLACAVGA